MAVPNEPSSGVTTYLLFEPEFPEHIAHLLDAQIYNGVHSGLMYLKAPLPANGIEVKVLELVVLPPPEHMNTTEEIQHLGDVLGGLVTEMVRDLWSWYNDHKE